MPYNICVILVLYEPNENKLTELINSLRSQVKKFFIYDNSIVKNLNYLNILKGIDFEYFGNLLNIGIAQAQNIMLLRAKEQGFKFALLSDQDTIYPNKYVYNLISSKTNLKDIAAICPNWTSLNNKNKSQENGQFVFNKQGKLILDNSSNSILYISHAISSGMIINLSVLDFIGLMSADLFIDWVDNDWCWRAAKAKYKIIYVPWVKIQHVLGDNQVTVLGRPFVKRNSIRNYYIVRNAIYLLIYGGFSRNIRIYLLKKAIHHIAFSAISSEKFYQEIHFLLRAVKDGIFKNMGKSNFKKIVY